MFAAADELLEIKPATKAGAAALLRHIASATWGLPDNLSVTDADCPFTLAAIRHVAASLENMTAA